jgi:hypothetical protein
VVELRDALLGPAPQGSRLGAELVAGHAEASAGQRAVQARARLASQEHPVEEAPVHDLGAPPAHVVAGIVGATRCRLTRLVVGLRREVAQLAGDRIDRAAAWIGRE